MTTADIIRWCKVAGIVTATAVGTLTLLKAYPQEYWLAHRGYVDERVAEKIAPLVPTVNELAKWQIEDSNSKYESEMAQWKIKIPSEQDPVIKDMIQRRMNEISVKQMELSRKANDLQGQLGAGHR